MRRSEELTLEPGVTYTADSEVHEIIETPIKTARGQLWELRLVSGATIALYVPPHVMPFFEASAEPM